VFFRSDPPRLKGLYGLLRNPAATQDTAYPKTKTARGGQKAEPDKSSDLVKTSERHPDQRGDDPQSETFFPVHGRYGFCSSSSGSLAILAAIRRASCGDRYGQRI
jgi:hypothetical protein